ncbi:MAG TPA: S8/S53 family peptidase [Bacteroidia bacterium]|nr:S8/S53 family peptidase [Bacteroidia bacterium]
MKQIITLLCTAWFAFSTTIATAGNNAKVIIPGQDPSRIPFQMNPTLKEGVDYLSKTIIFKVKPSYRQNCQVNSVNGLLSLEDFFKVTGAYNLAKIYPSHRKPAQETNEVGLKLVDLSLIYSFKYTSSVSISKLINQMKSLGYFEYVEPWYVPKVALTPNDPSYSNSGQLFCKGDVIGSINCQQAWDINQGSSSVIIGIVDTGTQTNHPDLAANFDGGYDVCMSDNDVTCEGSPATGWDHGASVSGDACAVTNNGVGVASPGFKCHFKVAKISNAAAELVAAYPGIVWAADNGCKIINNSWGGTGGGAYGQDIIDYAAINKNCLVLSAAGNDNADNLTYPGSFNNTYRVASSDQSDRRSSFSSYGLDVDFSSPGTNIYSTTMGSSYVSSQGTSMATPVACGAAGIIQSQFNYTNAFQIGEKLKQTCDPLANSTTNQTSTLFNAGKLGKGRIDLYRALTVAAKSIIANPITITDGNDDTFMPAETLSVSANFINYLDPSSSSASATLTIGSVSAGAVPAIVDGTYTIGALATLANSNNNSTPFKIVVDPSAPVNQVINCVLTITDGTFSGKQYFSITVNVDYINITINDVFTSISSKGKLGYNLDGQQQGLGFEYQLPSPENLLYEMSLMIGSSSTKVSDMFRGGGTAGDTDFGSITRVAKAPTNIVSDFDVNGKFNDAPAPSANPVEVRHAAYAWNTAPYRKFIIVKYVIKNTGGSALSSLYAGIIADWDITNSAANKADFDATNKMGYVYMTGTGGKYAAIKVLSSGAANHYVVDNVAGGNGGVDANAGTPEFATDEKYTVLSTSRNADGYTAAGGDVMSCVSTGPFTINAGDSVEVAFALIAGDNLADIQLTACGAQEKYNNGCTLSNINDVENDNFWMISYPNPASSTINFNYNVAESNATLTIVNTLGETIMTYNTIAKGKNTITMDVSHLSSGTYFYQLKAGDALLTKKFTITR